MFIIDFDDTLFDTYRWKAARLSAVAPFGVPGELVKETYRQIRIASPHGYSNERHARALEAHGFPYLPIKEAWDALTISSVLKGFVFDDAELFLKSLRALGQSMVLLSIGDPEFQAIKLQSSGLASWFDITKFVVNSKEQVVESLSSFCGSSEPVWFINNRVAETQAVLASCPRVRAILKISPDERLEDYAKSGLPYFNILTEISEYVRRAGEQ